MTEIDPFCEVMGHSPEYFRHWDAICTICWRVNKDFDYWGDDE